MKQYFGLCLIFLSNFSNVFSQTSGDTLTPFSVKELFNQIENNHPLFTIASIQEEYGKTNRSKAIGNFEPGVSYNGRNKTFNGKNYYDQNYFELDLFTPSPLSFDIGFEKNNGTYLNGESNTPTDGLGYIGFQLPLLKNLITDQRRTTLKQSYNVLEQSVFQKKSMMQSLYFEIWKNYIQWYINHEQTASLSKALDLSNSRLEAIRKVYNTGGCSGFDTLEISVQQQQFKAKLIENEIITLKSKILLSSHLWSRKDQNEIVPLSLKPNITPTNRYFDLLDPTVETTQSSFNISMQPDLVVSQKKVDNIELDLKLKKNYLLPKVDLKYQYLSTSYDQFNALTENSRFGLSVASPLFFIGPRAEFKETKFKLLEAQMSLKFKKREIEQKSLALLKQIEQYRIIYNMLKKVEMGYFQLYQMEIQKFNSGEGTIFLLNSREAKYWEANVKTIEQYGKMLMAMVEYLSVCGTLDRFNTALN